MTMMPAPAMPSTVRAAMKKAGDGAKAQATEPMPKRSSEATSTFLRPMRSPSKATGSMAAARVSR